MKENKDELRLDALAMVGIAVWRLQQLEHVISECFLISKKTKSTPDGYEFENAAELIEKLRKETLGRMFAAAKEKGFFNKRAQQKFEDFCERRNRLIHRIFTEPRFEELNRIRDIKALRSFARRLIEEALFYTEVFDQFLGLHLLMGVQDGTYELNDPSSKADAIDELRALRKKHSHLISKGMYRIKF